jgi:hypothetical protein
VLPQPPIRSMRSQLSVSAALIVATAAAWYAGWVLGGATGLATVVVLLSPAIALALAPLVVPLLGQSVQAARQLAYRDIQGRHFEYKGRSLRVQEDLAGDRWLRTADVRKIVVHFPRDQVLVRIAPEDIGRFGDKGSLFLRAQALDRYLERGQEDTTVRFRKWLQREVIFPAQRAGQLGPVRTSARATPPITPRG